MAAIIYLLKAGSICQSSVMQDISQFSQ